jgi:hypothetical protein
VSGNPPASLAGWVQLRLERFYGIEEQPPVEHFARTCGDGGREHVLLREQPDGVELLVALPAAGLGPASAAVSLDVMCQIVEGVSHFLYLAERIRTEMPTTHLELELQAEVDKFVVLGWGALATRDFERARSIHRRLYEGVRFLHAPGSEEGDRYRMANDLAARFCARLGARVAASGGARAYAARALCALRAFYRGGQTDKISLATAA